MALIYDTKAENRERIWVYFGGPTAENGDGQKNVGMTSSCCPLSVVRGSSHKLPLRMVQACQLFLFEFSSRSGRMQVFFANRCRD